MFTKRVIAAVVGLGLLGGLLLGVWATAGHVSAAPVAQAQPPATGAVAWATGKITALQSNGFTMQARNQQVTTVIVGANTWIVVGKNNKPTQGALSDLKVGDTVSVAGTVSGTNQIDARVVRQGGAGVLAGKPGKAGKAGKPAKPAAAGRLGLQATVQSVGNGTVTLAVGKNNVTRTVNTDAGTVVIKNGLASVADLKAGDKVEILPRRPANQPGTSTPAPGTAKPAPTAELIYVPSADHILGQAQVKSVSGNTLTLGGFNGQRTVNVDANTVYKTVTSGQAPAAATLSDVKAGSRIVVYAAKPAQGQTATASLVLILATSK